MTARRRVSSGALKQIQDSNVEKQQTVKPGREGTGYECENRKRTYTVSHEWKSSAFEIPEVDVEKYCNGESRNWKGRNESCSGENGTCKEDIGSSKSTKGRKSVCALQNEKSRLAGESVSDEISVNLQSEKLTNSSEVKPGNIINLNKKTTDLDVANESSTHTPPCKFMFCERTLHLDNVSSHDSVYTHMEALRMHLEKKLGTKLLTAVYRYVTNVPLEEHERVKQTVTCMLGDHNMTYFPVLLQLVACEAIYFH